MTVNAPQITSGENDPSIQVSGQVVGLEACTADFREAMRLLGFKESEGSFVYHAAGRAIWVNPKSCGLSADVTDQIVACAEAIGRRAKINEVRRALDLPFGEIAT